MKITKIIGKRVRPSDVRAFGVRKAREAVRFHTSLPEYQVTPLVSLKNLSADLGVQNIYIKDESKRFGLNAFKGLGGSFAIHKIAPEEPTTFVTATDGNHGRGIGWAAARLGHQAVVYMPRGSQPERLENIRKTGAHAEILDMEYDDVVRYAAKMAREKGWILTQDTSWKGYEEIPSYIMQGYTTMGYEIIRQLGSTVPTHVFLQAGVGSMAGAMTAFFTDFYGKYRPKIIIVEPDGANCFYETAEKNDGEIHFYQGEMHSIMAGLCCGEPCPIAWKIIRDHADYALSCPDHVTETGMRTLGHPLGDDEKIVSGESGAVTLGALVEMLKNPEDNAIADTLEINEKSVILCISTEGDTDHENYRKIVG